MFRELREEVGLKSSQVSIVGRTSGWLRYHLPRYLVRQKTHPLCIGQKQLWYLLRMDGDDQDVRLNLSENPEFDGWRWVDYWYPLEAVVPFKRNVYWHALRELAPLILSDCPPPDGCQPVHPSVQSR